MTVSLQVFVTVSVFRHAFFPEVEIDNNVSEN